MCSRFKFFKPHELEEDRSRLFESQFKLVHVHPSVLIVYLLVLLICVASRSVVRACTTGFGFQLYHCRDVSFILRVAPEQTGGRRKSKIEKGTAEARDNLKKKSKTKERKPFPQTDLRGDLGGRAFLNPRKMFTSPILSGRAQESPSAHHHFSLKSCTLTRPRILPLGQVKSVQNCSFFRT